MKTHVLLLALALGAFTTVGCSDEVTRTTTTRYDTTTVGPSAGVVDPTMHDDEETTTTRTRRVEKYEVD